jgi:hypothetical protein
MINIQGDQAPAKRQKMLKKFKHSTMKTVAKQSMSLQTLLGCYGGSEALERKCVMKNIRTFEQTQLAPS